MCLTCGCGDAHRRMGKNLTYEDLREIAIENDRPVDDVLRTLITTVAEDRIGHEEEYSRAWETPAQR